MSSSSNFRDERTVSPSPPPSFYRDLNAHAITSEPSHPMSLSETTACLELEDLPRSSVGNISSQMSGSMHASVMLKMNQPSKELNQLILLERRQKAIQADLQLLLDAQLRGLMRGSGEDVDEPSKSTSGKAPEILSRVTPVRQPQPVKMGLRDAREGIAHYMRELIEIKSNEIDVLKEEITKKKEVLRIMDAWEKKIVGITEQLDSHASEKDVELSQARNEEQAIELEILEMEKRLEQMKARRLVLQERILENSNRREAKLSSYYGALREVHSDLKDFLNGAQFSNWIFRYEVPNFSVLSPRASLQVAKEWWAQEISQIQRLQHRARVEQMALEEGVQLWETNMQLVITFENGLRKDIEADRLKDAHMLTEQLPRLATLLATLAHGLHYAEEKGWTLLICALGAEVDAIRKGQAILSSALQASERDESSAAHDDAEGAYKSALAQDDGEQDRN
ncbi:hypothetical protein K3495_g5675 [Podosphaera aphanis]|nr:hypothetical protein K3495_g5675 [Podosphaera aphanis]